MYLMHLSISHQLLSLQQLSHGPNQLSLLVLVLSVVPWSMDISTTAPKASHRSRQCPPN